MQLAPTHLRRFLLHLYRQHHGSTENVFHGRNRDVYAGRSLCLRAQFSERGLRHEQRQLHLSSEPSHREWPSLQLQLMQLAATYTLAPTNCVSEGNVMSESFTGRIKTSLPMAVLVLIVLHTSVGSCRAQMTAQEFNAMSDADKRTILVNTLQDRERAVGNLRATSVTRLSNVVYRDGKLRSVLKDVSRYDCELRRGKKGHWASINWFLSDILDRPTQEVITSLDVMSGVARSTAKQDGLKGIYGAIDNKEDMLIRASRFNYWFDANFEPPQNFPISFLLKHQDAIKFDSPEKSSPEIRVSLHVKTDEGTPYQDTRTVWLDPRRGFMPVRMHWRWQYDSKPPLDQDMVTEIKKLELVGGFWFPTHFTETCVCKKSIEEGYATVYETTVGKISLGTITENDLVVHFPVETEVHDRLKGVRFRANDATQAAPLVSAREASKRPRQWLLVVTLVGLIVVSAILLLSRHRTRVRAAFPAQRTV